VLVNMKTLRKHCDHLETIIPKKIWYFPAYSDILFDI
jgi:glutamine synthetase type III